MSVQTGSYACTIVTVTSCNGFTDHVIESRVFMGKDHDARARDWGAPKDDGWARRVTYQASSVEVV